MQADRFIPQEYTLADQASADERAGFIVKTYAHLFGAVLALVAIEAMLLRLPIGDQMMELLSRSQYSWLIVLGAFMGVSYLADRWAHSDVSAGIQYAGLALYVVAQAVILLPMLYIAQRYSSPTVIPTAAIITLCTFTGLTAIVVATRKNFSFLGPFLGIAGLGAFGLIVCSILFGFSLGIVFTAAMIVFACGYILYHTSNVLHEYRVDQHVAASLALFASVMLLFWYVLRLVMSRD